MHKPQPVKDNRFMAKAKSFLLKKTSLAQQLKHEYKVLSKQIKKLLLDIRIH